MVYFKWVKYEVCELYLKKLCLFFLKQLSLVIFATGLHREFWNLSLSPRIESLVLTRLLPPFP